VFLDRDVTEAERQGLEAAIDNHPQVASHEFWDQAESLAEARRIFRNHAEMLVPSSIRITLTHADPATAGQVAADLQDQPGVMQVTIVKGSLMPSGG
jgi:cell division protein FtsX